MGYLESRGEKESRCTEESRSEADASSPKQNRKRKKQNERRSPRARRLVHRLEADLDLDRVEARLLSARGAVAVRGEAAPSRLWLPETARDLGPRLAV